MDGAIGKKARVGFDFSFSELYRSFSPFPIGAAAVAPRIQPGPEEVNVPTNGSATLLCQAEGWPTPRVTWRKDGQLLSLRGTSRYKALQLGGTQSWLPVEPLSPCPLRGRAPSGCGVPVTLLAVCPCVFLAVHSPWGLTSSPSLPLQAAAATRWLPAH